MLDFLTKYCILQYVDRKQSYENLSTFLCTMHKHLQEPVGSDSETKVAQLVTMATVSQRELQQLTTHSQLEGSEREKIGDGD